ncbi:MULTISPECIES: hypothetical protein [Micromonospora]|uniref:hypothetical protein n=1 Tax=Micromonospora TaxID=1873 RepID=UPI001585D4DF|nr:hypothetical protein [Micromonospora yangpuensis]GGL88173.1 hypothetical protein GCM10012279_02310 [Micromonospora yangpuensis]
MQGGGRRSGGEQGVDRELRHRHAQAQDLRIHAALDLVDERSKPGVVVGQRGRQIVGVTVDLTSQHVGADESTGDAHVDVGGGTVGGVADDNDPQVSMRTW